MSKDKFDHEDAVGERIGEHLLGLISGGDDADERHIDYSTDGNNHGVGWRKITWGKSF